MVMNDWKKQIQKENKYDVVYLAKKTQENIKLFELHQND